MAVDGTATDVNPRIKHPLLGLLVAQFLGAFNDNAWKQVVIVLGVDAVLASGRGLSKETESQAMASFAQIVLMIPLMLFSLPAGVLADRVSKRSVILAMKVLELVADGRRDRRSLFQPVAATPRRGPRASARRSGGALQSRRSTESFPRSCRTSDSRRATACSRCGRTWRSSRAWSRVV